MSARLLSTRDAAAYLACGLDELRRLVAANEIVPLRLSANGRAKYDRDDLDNFIKRRKALA